VKVIFFSVLQNGSNGLGDEGAEGQCPPEFFGLELPVGGRGIKIYNMDETS